MQIGANMTVLVENDRGSEVDIPGLLENDRVFFFNDTRQIS